MAVAEFVCIRRVSFRNRAPFPVQLLAVRMHYWELLAWLFRSFLAVTAFAFVVAGYQTLRSRPRRGRSRKK